MAKVEADLASTKCRGGDAVARAWFQEADGPGFQIPATHILAYCSTTVPVFTCKMGITIVNTS